MRILRLLFRFHDLRVRLFLLLFLLSHPPRIYRYPDADTVLHKLTLN